MSIGVMRGLTEAIVKTVLDNWSDYTWTYYDSKLKAQVGEPNGVIDANRIVAATGVSKSTAYQVKARAEYLHDQAKAQANGGDSHA